MPNRVANGLLTQKDLMARWECTTRTVQRARKEFDLMPVDFWGINPLFLLADVERVEKHRLYKRLKHLERKAGKKTGIVTTQQLRRVKRASNGRAK